ncbi:baseplate wedge subunit [Pseudomonas phage PspYZU05]|uniref:Baseplate wedge subunit n=1 Tax=Pseudomonas phage PspYZU05 TaxID=1983556 RepID=A0A2U7NS00_9CAUD|nr:baseplate wedge subunit [Pseudomonas phage PspYZU05]ASD52062.1 baseplate wedge subunit [Pseudomonas phage PspYZU05]
MIFSFFDPIMYKAKTINENAESVPITDIFRNYKAYYNRVAPRYKLRNYYISGSPRPEELAYQLYGNTQLYWVLLMANNIYDPFYDWITSQDAAYQMADQRYKDLGGNQVLYHKDLLGNKYYNLVQKPDTFEWYDKGDLNFRYVQFNGALAAVDIYEDAILQNEEKRNIVIVAPEDIDSFVDDIIREMEIA